MSGEPSTHEHSEVSEVLIAGAGPTGLLLALWLTRLGVHVRIVDPKPGPTTETRAIAVQARTLEFYDQLGLGPETLAHGRPFDTVNLWVNGRLAGAVQLNGAGEGETPHPDLYILTQDQNEAMLVRQLESLGTKVEWHTELTDFTQREQGVSAILTSSSPAPTAQTRTVQAHYLAGCDGASSLVRHKLDIPMTGGTYAKHFYVADVTAGGRLHQGSVNLCFNVDHFLGFFPMSQAGRHRVIGQVPDSAGEAPSFETVRPQIEAFGLTHIEQVHWFSSYRVHHRVADSFCQGRVFLLGDAAHLHSPVGGQGMNTGLGDAVNLGWKLAQAIRNPESEVLDSYQPERLPFARSLVGITDRVFTAFFAGGALAQVLRTQIVPALVPRLTQFGAVKKRLFLTVSQTSLHYPDSSLSVGQAGKVKGGDRLPWIPQHQGAGEPGSNFDALKSLRWQLHVYGAPSPELLTWCAQTETPLHASPFSKVAHRAGVAEDALYLVRPDGYVGWASPRFDQGNLDAYVRRWVRNSGPPVGARHPIAAD